MITKRGKRVRALAIVALIVALWWLAGALWWTGAGWCIGSLNECMAGGL